ncbi:HAMP domain-containing histidine kinase [Clostridium sp. MSJ-11]|uniref:histidine kinase n=1 Tax=Clostridium mobile TaxID=2841512 RepID=A0ABS6EI25_9CLOT|nr:ATP-binding protein [Clostridium mobile]MBU5484797.1 HAMP domain-containing histidine kinase [Clostridium mobile]
MYSIRKKILMFFLISSLTTLIISAFFVNSTINNTFKDYMEDLQNKRDERIIQYFQQVYKKDKQWKKNSGEELVHEAYMSNYCLTLMDENKNIIWSMNPDEIKARIHMENMMGQNKGVYTTDTYEITDKGKVVGYVSIGQYSSLLLSEEDIKFKNRINEGIFISLIFAVIITIIISIYLSKDFSKPIKKVSDISVELSRGNYDVESNNESNIIEINNLQSSIEGLKEKLKNQDALRKRLVSDISHEVRTPLNILQNNLEAMMDGIIPINDDTLSGLNDEVIRFSKLLDNLNVLKEMEGKDINLDFQKISLNKIISAVIQDFKVTSKEKGVTINFDNDDKEYFISGDENSLKQVFINLISNSLKFVEEGGKVWINIEETKENIVVEVIDNGVGIKKEDLPFVFERLYRGDKSRNKIEGSGIGLAIVKNILTFHSAWIKVESDVDRGTKISINFKKI